MKNRIEWTDNYKLKLCVYHHLAEVKRKFENYVDIEDNEYASFGETVKSDKTKDRAWECVEKEMTDLYLLIESYLSLNNKLDLIDSRINRFNQKKVENGQHRKIN